MASALSPSPPPLSPSPGPILSYYDQARLKFLNAPFNSPREKAEYEIPLEKWGEACETNQVARRNFYRGKGVVKREDLEASASFSCKITSEKTGRTIKVLFFRNIVSEFEADAVINAANETLLGGGGVDKDIHDGAGPNLIKECATHENGCEVGEAVITKGYDLPEKYVLHTVGPLLNKDGSGNAPALKSCYTSCLALCDKFKLGSVVAPCVATGFYAFPMKKSAEVVHNTLQEYVDSNSSTVHTLILSLPLETEWIAYTNEFQKKPAEHKKKVK